jgi:NADPH-dependent glutamate synthase beta subunit-like oxidoreductase
MPPQPGGRAVAINYVNASSPTGISRGSSPGRPKGFSHRKRDRVVGAGRRSFRRLHSAMRGHTKRFSSRQDEAGGMMRYGIPDTASPRLLWTKKT